VSVQQAVRAAEHLDQRVQATSAEHAAKIQSFLVDVLGTPFLREPWPDDMYVFHYKSEHTARMGRFLALNN